MGAASEVLKSRLSDLQKERVAAESTVAQAKTNLDDAKALVERIAADIEDIKNSLSIMGEQKA
jgi:hypothetical protein